MVVHSGKRAFIPWMILPETRTVESPSFFHKINIISFHFLQVGEKTKQFICRHLCVSFLFSYQKNFKESNGLGEEVFCTETALTLSLKRKRANANTARIQGHRCTASWKTLMLPGEEQSCPNGQTFQSYLQVVLLNYCYFFDKINIISFQFFQVGEETNNIFFVDFSVFFFWVCLLSFLEKIQNDKRTR